MKNPVVAEIKEKITPILEDKEVEFAGLFGSYSRGEEGENSDIDILVKFSSPKSLLDLVGLEIELSELFKKKVNLVTENFLSPYFRKDVLNNALPLYEKK